MTLMNLTRICLKKYRKLEQDTVLSAIYKKSLFTDNNIRFNEKQTYFSDTKSFSSAFK